MQNLKSIDLFCGIGGFRLGLEPLGVKTVFANDIKSDAIDVYKSNFGDEGVVLADITQFPIRDIPSHDFLCAGFPCQPFSPAGKKLGVADPTNGTLFKTIVEIIEYHQPTYFILENVRRMISMENGRHFHIILNALCELGYEIEWRIINTISFGIPQHRQRIFITGKKIKGTRKKFLPRLIHPNTDDLFGDIDLSDSALTPLNGSARKFNFWGYAREKKYIHQYEDDDLKIKPHKKLSDILQTDHEVESYYDQTPSTLERLKSSNKVDRFYNGVEILNNQGGGARLGYTIFGTNGFCSTLTASTSRHYERYKIGNKYRRLTNIEYARLMGFPDDWCRVLSLYHQHSAFGNAVVPQCVEWVARKLIKNG